MTVCDWATNLKDFGTPLIALVAAIASVSAYRKNGKTRRADFLSELHQSFFVSATYKDVRLLLEPATDEQRQKLDILVGEGDLAFTDFSNFFEMVAYLENQNNLTLQDVKALLGYYLDLLKSTQNVRAYIDDPKYGFEHLSALLGKL